MLQIQESAGKIKSACGNSSGKKRDCQNYKEYQEMDTRIVFVNPLKYFSLLKNSSCLKHTCIHVLSLKGGRMEL